MGSLVLDLDEGDLGGSLVVAVVVRGCRSRTEVVHYRGSVGCLMEKMDEIVALF